MVLLQLELPLNTKEQSSTFLPHTCKQTRKLGEAAQLSRAVRAYGTLVNEVGVAKGTSPAPEEKLLQPSWFRLGKMAVAGAASGEPLVQWCTQQLRKTFALDVSEEIIQ